MADGIRIAQCGSDGRLELDAMVYCDMDEQTSHSIKATSEGERAVLAAKLDVADSERAFGAYAEAVNAYIAVFDRCIEHKAVKRGYEDVAHRAYNGLAAMSHSDDEYAWESTAEMVETYAKILGLR